MVKLQRQWGWRGRETSRRGIGNAVAEECVSSCQASASRKILGKTGTTEELRKGKERSKTFSPGSETGLS